MGEVNEPVLEVWHRGHHLRVIYVESDEEQAFTVYVSNPHGQHWQASTRDAPEMRAAIANFVGTR